MLRTYGWRARIGLISPSRSTNEEEEMRKAAPKGVQFISSKLLHSIELNPADRYAKMLNQIEQAAEELASSDVQGIIQMGGAMSMFQGWNADKEIVARIEKATGIPAASLSLAEIESLKKLNINKVLAFTAYDDERNAAVEKYFSGSGIDLVLIKSLRQENQNTDDVISISPFGLYRPIKEAFLNAPPADGIIILCGGAATMDIIQPLEYDTGKPVVTASSAALWKALNLVSVREPIKGYGKLLETF